MARDEPELREDGLCAQCRKPRRHAVGNRYSGQQAVLDPFCSAVCCRLYHRVDKPSKKPGWPKGKTKAYAPVGETC